MGRVLVTSATGNVYRLNKQFSNAISDSSLSFVKVPIILVTSF